MIVMTERATLNAAGQCCGRKPLIYKRPNYNQFCSRCCRGYDGNGQQIENWAWKEKDGAFSPAYPKSDYVGIREAWLERTGGTE